MNTNARAAAVYPLADEAPPTHYIHRVARHAPPPPPPPPQNVRCSPCIVVAIVVIFCASVACIPVVLVLIQLSHTPKIRVDSVSVSSFSVDSSTVNHSVTSNWNIGFHAEEEKNEKLLWEEPEAVVSVFYKEVKLTSMLLHEYMNSCHVSLMVSKSTGTSSASVTEQVAKAIEVDRSNGVVNLTIAIDGIFRIFLRGDRYEKTRVRCGAVKVGFSHHNATTGTMLGESTKCKLH